MNKDMLMTDASVTDQQTPRNGMTRRHVLRRFTQASLLVGTAAAGGAVLTSCGQGSSPNEPVTLSLGDWPIKASLLKTKGTPKDPGDAAELEVLQAWLSKNKNVTIKQNALDLGDDQKKQASIAARTTPAVVGTFGNKTLNRNAAKLKYAAELTSLYQQHDVDNLMASYARPFFEQEYHVDGKYFALPGDALGAGAGLYYRRDLLKEKGIPDPEFGWTWDDMFSLLRKFQKPGKPVMGAPSWMFGWYFNSNTLDRQDDGILGSTPAPDQPWHWKVNIDPWIDSWKRLAETYRKVVLDDKLIEQNATAYPWEGPAMGKYAAGEYPFSPGYAFQGTIPGYAPVTPVDMPAKFGKTFDELVGFVAYPKGDNGAYNSGIYASMTGQVMFPHYLKTGELEKAVDLYLYRVYGDGYINKYSSIYNKTKDGKQAYTYVAPANKYQKNPKVPADVTVESAYGPKWVKSYMDVVTKLKPLPVRALYFPADKQTGPTNAAHDDALSKLSQTRDDITTILHTFQNTYNQQASSLASDISAADFKTAAKTYFAALDTYFKENLPDFYAGDWNKYYNQLALPAIK